MKVERGNEKREGVVEVEEVVVIVVRGRRGEKKRRETTLCAVLQGVGGAVRPATPNILKK